VSAGEWIDSNVEVEIVSGTQDRVQVRPVCTDGTRLKNHGQPLLEPPKQSVDALEAPPAWVERINPIQIGFVGGAVIGLIIWIQGEPLSLAALSVPMAGALSGWIFRKLVGIPAEAAGPYADHRPMAIGVAFAICFVTCIGALIGFDVSGSFLGTSCGLVTGTVVSGVLIAILVFFSHV
jgi:hypothetical protein